MEREITVFSRCDKRIRPVKLVKKLIKVDFITMVLINERIIPHIYLFNNQLRMISNSWPKAQNTVPHKVTNGSNPKAIIIVYL